ncbi:VOC family protein [Chryseolinea sp. T2]|uniref:VOC family protein n=1 Tax=Chryseolinea sp. T2 TaxID=3129255 RepID=UPI0030781784
MKTESSKNTNSSKNTGTSKNRGVKPIPDGFHTITPFLIVNDAHELLSFIEKGLGGKTQYKLEDDDGKIVHASARVGDSAIMISDTMQGMEPVTAMLYLYVENADNLYNQALAVNGVTSAREVRTEFYGDRAGCIQDQWGNKWWIATHVEDVSNEELERRKSEMLKEAHA